MKLPDSSNLIPTNKGEIPIIDDLPLKVKSFYEFNNIKTNLGIPLSVEKTEKTHTSVNMVTIKMTLRG